MSEKTAEVCLAPGKYIDDREVDFMLKKASHGKFTAYMKNSGKY